MKAKWGHIGLISIDFRVFSQHAFSDAFVNHSIASSETFNVFIRSGLDITDGQAASSMRQYVSLCIGRSLWWKHLEIMS